MVLYGKVDFGQKAILLKQNERDKLINSIIETLTNIINKTGAIDFDYTSPARYLFGYSDSEEYLIIGNKFIESNELSKFVVIDDYIVNTDELKVNKHKFNMKAMTIILDDLPTCKLLELKLKYG